MISKESIFQTISNILHPLNMCSYATILLCIYTPIIVYPLGLRLFLVVEVFFYTFVIPVLVIWLLYKLKLIEHYNLRSRKDRILPLVANTLSYAACSLSLAVQGILPNWALFSYYGMTVIAFLALLISFWWKISGHAIGLAGLMTASWFYYFLFRGMFIPLALPFILLILLGLQCSIRLYLGRHTTAQVYAGCALGIGVMCITFWLLMS